MSHDHSYNSLVEINEDENTGGKGVREKKSKPTDG